MNVISCSSFQASNGKETRKEKSSATEDRKSDVQNEIMTASMSLAIAQSKISRVLFT